jgi:hypothetical protein
MVPAAQGAAGGDVQRARRNGRDQFFRDALPYRRVKKLDMPDLPPKYDPTGVGTHQSDDETNDPVIADHLNFYKVEKWTKDGSNVDHMLYAGSNLDKAREVFAAAIKHRPRIRLTIRQRMQVFEQWPVSAP